MSDLPIGFLGHFCVDVTEYVGSFSVALAVLILKLLIEYLHITTFGFTMSPQQSCEMSKMSLSTSHR